ncbi:hypothetical protein HMPREF9952_0145 [Haemophilus pittmaniae HK 85]|uniref:Uncharacterized protein n=1 Tax=Haemophilus pittmaniae HK 85 TaxID=1035188 RepID=F9Q7P8_9PAST|nr:hypothetical protein HMPREF9952_0145 [Haemophilus pittmaniae HK 85]
MKKPEVKVETAQQPQPKNEPAKIETAKKAEVKTDAASGEKNLVCNVELLKIALRPKVCRAVWLWSA